MQFHHALADSEIKILTSENTISLSCLPNLLSDLLICKLRYDM